MSRGDGENLLHFFNSASYDKGLAFIQKKLDVKASDHETLLLNKAKFLRFKGKYQEGISIIESLYDRISLEDTNIYAELLIEHAYQLWFINDFEQVQEILSLCNEINIEDLDHNQMIQSYIDHLRGNIEMRKGRINQSIDLYKQGISRIVNLEDKLHLAILYYNLGYAQYLATELGEAKSNVYASLQIGHNLKNFHVIGADYMILGFIAQVESDETKAISYFESSLNALTQVSDEIIQVSESQFLLFYSYLQQENTGEAEYYLEELKKNSQKTDNQIIILRYRLATALFLKSQNRLFDKVEGVRILKEIIDSEVLYYDMTIIAIQNYIEFLIDEYKLYKNHETYLELQSLIEELLEYGENQGRYNLVVECLVLFSKLSFIEGNLKKAMDCLDKSINISDEKNLKMEEMSLKEKDRMLLLETNSNVLQKEDGSLAQRIEDSEIIQYLEDVKKIMKK